MMITKTIHAEIYWPYCILDFYWVFISIHILIHTSTHWSFILYFGLILSLAILLNCFAIWQQWIKQHDLFSSVRIFYSRIFSGVKENSCVWWWWWRCYWKPRLRHFYLINTDNLGGVNYTYIMQVMVKIIFQKCKCKPTLNS